MAVIQKPNDDGGSKDVFADATRPGVLPHWPSERFIELAPQNWAVTRARLSAAELDGDV